jgi:acetyltransferase-like isoleucine patch superfamily enzyme
MIVFKYNTKKKIMIKYLLGLINNFFNVRISKLALIDNKSTFDKTARVCRHVKIINSNIGGFTYVASKTQILEGNIGKFCSIASDCRIGLASHSLNYISTSPIFTSKNNATKYQWIQRDMFEEIQKVNIGNDVWIGIGSIIMGGVSVGDGAVVAAGAIVTKDVPPYSIVAGVPAKVIKYRFEKEIIEFLSEVSWWDWPIDKLKNKLNFFSMDSFNMSDLKELNNHLIDL